MLALVCIALFALGCNGFPQGQVQQDFPDNSQKGLFQPGCPPNAALNGPLGALGVSEEKYGCRCQAFPSNPGDTEVDLRCLCKLKDGSNGQGQSFGQGQSSGPSQVNGQSQEVPRNRASASASSSASSNCGQNGQSGANANSNAGASANGGSANAQANAAASSNCNNGGAQSTQPPTVPSTQPTTSGQLTSTASSSSVSPTLGSLPPSTLSSSAPVTSTPLQSTQAPLTQSTPQTPQTSTFTTSQAPITPPTQNPAVVSTTSTAAPSTVAPSTGFPSTAGPSTAVPSTAAPSTFAPSTVAPSTVFPSTAFPSTAAPSTFAPSTAALSTTVPSTFAPSTAAFTTVPSTFAPSTAGPSTAAPSTTVPSTTVPSTAAPSTAAPLTPSTLPSPQTTTTLPPSPSTQNPPLPSSTFAPSTSSALPTLQTNPTTVLPSSTSQSPIPSSTQAPPSPSTGAPSTLPPSTSSQTNPPSPVPSTASLPVISSSTPQIPPTSSSGDIDTSHCPYGCPKGWVRFGFTDHCYRLPAQPVIQDTFWNHQRRCQEMDPAAYVAVVNSLAEQAMGTPVALEYSPNWILAAGNGFLWLGGYTDEKGWKFLDGTDQTSSILMLAANIIGSQKNDTCLGADIKTMGFWQTRPCSDKTGAAFCEMPRRRVCGEMGSILPISPIYITPGTLANLFPKLPSIPFIGQIFGESTLDSAITGIGSSISCWLGGECYSGGASSKPTELPSGCRLDCPAGWITWSRSPDAHCYLIPNDNAPAVADTFWNMQDRCTRTESSSYVAMVNRLFEQAMMTSIMKQNGPKWLESQNGTLKDAKLWLGTYTGTAGYYHLDDSSGNGNLLMAIANLDQRKEGTFSNGSCLAADPRNAGDWKLESCNSKGFALCEMLKKPLCGDVPGGKVVDIQLDNLTPESIKELFPNMPSNVPFLAEVINGSSQAVFDPVQAGKNNQTGEKYGDSVANIMCVKRYNGWFSSLTSKPSWTFLEVNGNQMTATGQWTKVKCKSGTVDTFKVLPITALSAWTRCYNDGYEMAMPTGGYFSGWYPFQVDESLSEYYREESGWFGKFTADYKKESQKDIKDC